MMMTRFLLMSLTGVGCWLLTSRCFSKQIDELEHQTTTPTIRPYERTMSTYTLPKWNELDHYSYDDYLLDIPNKMVKSDHEYQVRKTIFDENLHHIQSFNQQRQDASHRLGVNHFMDRLPHELPQPGYDKSQHEQWSQNAIDQSIVSKSDAETGNEQEFDYWSMIDQLNMQKLPQHVDWRTNATTGQSFMTPVKDQGICGSCWAFATTAALESHVAMANHHHTLMSLSMQELVSCVPNPNHCGGTGGCGGSTAELALDFVHHHGLVDEWHFGYQSYAGTHPVECSLHNTNPPPQDEQEPLNNNKYYDNAAVTVSGHVKLPTNNYTALMHAVAKHGPVIVNVAADPWRFYEGGVFAAHGHGVDHTDINHVVVLYGYGTDQQTGQDYWLVRNSYGPLWGEDGFIRLLRVDPSNLPQPDADCGMDVRPADGIACTEQNHRHHVKPPAVKVCGTSGILFDPVLPIGAKLL